MPSLAAYTTPLPRQAARRRGQALLIAVLVMIFVGVLGSTFVALIMVNMASGRSVASL